MAHELAQPPPATPAPPSRAASGPGRLRGWWGGFVGAIGAVVGLAPHVLHHAGPLVGAAVVAGTGGTLLFGALGLIASIPLLICLGRRFAGWWAPTIALAVFAATFSISTFVIGPMISGGRAGEPGGDQPAPSSTDHTGHHER